MASWFRLPVWEYYWPVLYKLPRLETDDEFDSTPVYRSTHLTRGDRSVERAWTELRFITKIGAQVSLFSSTTAGPSRPEVGAAGPSDMTERPIPARGVGARARAASPSETGRLGLSASARARAQLVDLARAASVTARERREGPQ